MKNYKRVMIKTMKILGKLDFHELNFKTIYEFSNEKGIYKANFATKKITLYSKSDEDFIEVITSTILGKYMETFYKYSNNEDLICKIFTTSHEVGHIFYGSLLNNDDNIIRVMLASISEAYCTHLVQTYKKDFTDESKIVLCNNHRLKVDEAASDAYAFSRMPYILSKLTETRKDINFKKYPKLACQLNKADLEDFCNKTLLNRYNISKINNDTHNLFY